MKITRFHAPLIPLLAVLALAGGWGIGTFIHSLSSSPHRHIVVGAHAAAAAARAGAVSAPSCPSPTGSLPTTISMSTNTASDNFNQSCYYAAAGQPFSISFTNTAYATMDGSPTSLNIVISPSTNPAIAPAPNSPLVVGIMSKAVFVSSFVTAPNAATFSVPALQAGTYDLQIEDLPDAIATLVVQ